MPDLDMTLSADGSPLHLRPWRAEDASALMVAYDDAEIRRWLMTSLDSVEAAARSIEKRRAAWIAGTRYDFAVWEGDLLLGSVTLKTGTASGTPEVGYWTAPYARGRGVAAHALETLTTWAFETFGPLRRLDLIHSIGNHASCRIAAKCGYRLDRILPPEPPWPDDGHLHVRTAAD